jgi:putative ABC transport system permease protein
VPEPPPPLRTYTYLAYLGAVVGVLGALLFATTYQGTSDISYPILGGSMVLFGGALVAARFVKNRIAFSALGLGLILWTGVEPLHAALFGTSHTGGVFLTFVVGVLMVGGALILFVFNGADLARGLERLIGGRTGTTPVARIGLANPSRRAARTAITLAIFALVLFTIVVLATFSSTLTGNLENSITSESGGYTFFGFSAQPIPDLPGQVANNSSLSSVVSEAVPVVTGAARIVVPDDPQHPYLDNVYAAPLGGPPNSDFYTTNQFPFQSTLSGWSAATVMHELSTNASVAVVDGSYGASSQFSFSGAHPSVAVGATIRVLDPANRDSANLTVIGILQETILAGVWVNPTTATALGYHALNGYLFTVPSGASVNTASQRLKVAFFPYGLVLFQFSSVLAQTIAIISGDIGLLEVFIALGLAVGIAALGILALRAVAERRREIGMLRATGMTRMMILKAFLLEYTFITLLGAAIGGLLGLLVVYNLVIGPSGSSAGVTTLFVPWANLGLVMLVTGGLATLAVIGPSLRGARLPPAEAIRSRE